MKSVNVRIDKQIDNVGCHHVIESDSNKESPLYVCPWSPSKLAVGRIHSMTVTAVLKDGSAETIITSDRQFVLDLDALRLQSMSNLITFCFYFL